MGRLRCTRRRGAPRQRPHNTFGARSELSEPPARVRPRLSHRGRTRSHRRRLQGADGLASWAYPSPGSRSRELRAPMPFAAGAQTRRRGWLRRRGAHRTCRCISPTRIAFAAVGERSLDPIRSDVAVGRQRASRSEAISGWQPVPHHGQCAPCDRVKMPDAARTAHPRRQSDRRRTDRAGPPMPRAACVGARVLRLGGRRPCRRGYFVRSRCRRGGARLQAPGNSRSCWPMVGH
mmetsp:Transcript_54554/g.167994  ORF Transcript_54554/g.167994 Transcript_54554/m.167994 type:complete len:234 (+) Transcript_54554:863-1564(+)